MGGGRALTPLTAQKCAPLAQVSWASVPRPGRAVPLTPLGPEEDHKRGRALGMEEWGKLSGLWEKCPRGSEHSFTPVFGSQ